MRIVIKYLSMAALGLTLCACGANPKLSKNQSNENLENINNLLPNAESSLEDAITENKLSEIKRIFSQKPYLINSYINKAGENPLHVAIRANANETMKWILEQKNLNLSKTTIEGDSYLVYAAKYNQVEAIREILATMPSNYSIRNLDFPNERAQRAIHFARSKKSFFLLLNQWKKEGFSIEEILSVDKMGRNPLHYTALYGSADILQSLIPIVCSQTVLNKAVEFFRLYGEYIFEANVYNQRDYIGNSPLQLAISAKSPSAVRALLACPFTSATLKNDRKQSPLHTAVLTQDRETFLAFLEVRKTLKYIREINVNLNSRDSEYGNSPLHYAAAIPDRFFYDYLVNMGGMTNLANDEVITPAQIFAQFHGSANMSQY